MKSSAALLFACLTFAAAAEPPPMPEPARAKIPDRTFSIANYGARGDGRTMNTEPIRAAIAACAKSGGGRVVVPAGTWLTGPIVLASRTALVLEKGAVLQASDKFADFGLPDPLPEKQAEIDAYKKALQPLVSGSKLEDVEISGSGIIDGAGAGWWAKSDKASERAFAAAKAAPASPEAAKPEKALYVPRPHLIVLRDCARVHIQGVTLRNSPMFHLVPHHCREVLVDGITINSPEDAPNTDGIDPANSRDVLIRRCTVDTGDDNIALKGGGLGGEPTENVTVTDCTFLHGHGVSIGSETEAGVRNFLVQRCTFRSTGTALRIKSDRTRGGIIENVTYRDITMQDVETPITISLFYDDKKAALRPELKERTPSTPTVRNVRFTNVTCEGATKKAGDIAGLPESPIAGLTLENVRITGAAGPFTIQDARDLRTSGFEVQTTQANVEPK